MLCLHAWPVGKYTLKSLFFFNADSFILTLRRLVAWRENIRSIYSGNGGDFIGSEQELKEACMEMNDRKIQPFLLEQNGDWVR